LSTRWRVAILIAVVVAVGAVMAAKQLGSVPDAPATGEAEAVAALPRFVEVGAEKCVPCKMMQPVLDELRADYAGRVSVEFADVWKNPELGRTYDVRSIPTQVIYDRAGKEVFRHLGFWPKEDIDAKLRELGIVD